MAKNKSLNAVLAELPAARRSRIEKRAKALIAEEYSLRNLRKARQLTQQELADRTGKAQANIVRIEQQSDLLLSTLRKHVEAMGGELEVRVRFPDSEPVLLGRFAEDAAPAKKKRASRA